MTANTRVSTAHVLINNGLMGTCLLINYEK